MAVRQDINVGLLGFVGIVGTMLLAISIWGLEAWYAYEVDLLRQVRFQENRNLTWTHIRDEQYANIGDTVGNATVYAAAEAGGEAMGWGCRLGAQTLARRVVGERALQGNG